MSVFIRKTISQGQTLSEKLKRARLEKKLTLEELAKQTKIQIKYLEGLENRDYGNLPGDVYIRTWIRMYSQAVGLPPQELLLDYKLEKQLGNKNKIVKTKKKFDWHNILKPRVIKWSVIVLIFLAFSGYLGWEINNIISPPLINIIEPANDLKTTESSVKVSGQTLPEVQLKINNEIILLDDQGNFSQNVNLAIGLNNLEISAKKKHSKTNIVQLTILREITE